MLLGFFLLLTDELVLKKFVSLRQLVRVHSILLKNSYSLVVSFVIILVDLDQLSVVHEVILSVVAIKVAMLRTRNRIELRSEVLLVQNHLLTCTSHRLVVTAGPLVNVSRITFRDLSPDRIASRLIAIAYLGVS